MKHIFKYLLYIILMLNGSFLLSSTNFAFSQSYTTESKSCGSCGKSVSINSRVGMRCPHCGVRWGYENTSTKTTTVPNYNYPSTNYSYGDVITTRVNANLRKGASTNNSVIRVIPAHQTVTVIRKQGDWYYVRYTYYDSYYYNSHSEEGYLHKSTIR